MKYHLKYVYAVILAGLMTSCDESHEPKTGLTNEMVMTNGMSITAKTPEGTIVITAGTGFERSYTWDGETRSVKLWPRWERWYGSLGAYYPGDGSHWRNNHGITRGVLDEGQQHFETEEEAMKWINGLPHHAECVYRDDGLMVWWRRTPAARTLNLEVWQIYVAGQKPTKMEGSENSNILTKGSALGK
jgi:hypothetical protein